MKTIYTFILSLSCLLTFAQETIEYPSKDGLLITADLYEASNSDTFILLFHQAGWSRGEYKETAPKLNALGYTCLAVDQRSGGEVNDITNETNKRAQKAGKKTAYIDAFQDIEATVSYVKKTYNPKKIIIWGSSYSSSLVLKYAGDYPNSVQAVVSFSPGEYFENKSFITSSAKSIQIPTFITSGKNEVKSWAHMYNVIPAKAKQSYIPKTKGNHGSRALWNTFDDSKGYWDAVQKFLKNI